MRRNENDHPAERPKARCDIDVLWEKPEVLLEPEETSSAFVNQCRDFSEIRQEIRTCLDHQKALLEEIKRLKMDDQVLSELSRRCQELAERFHEREVLQPVFLRLIGIADRCRRNERQLTPLLDRLQAQRSSHRKKFVEALRASREADRLEIEEALANFSVERFEHPGSQFNASAQKCVENVSSHKPEFHGRVAQRLHPGYRRNGTMIRPEYVAVYVNDAGEARREED